MTKVGGQAGARVPTGTLPLGAAVALFAALLILFGWLHFILALQVAETNQQIQDSTRFLEGLRRTNATLRQQVARAQSPRLMEHQAIAAGYRPKKPIHIPLPIASSAGAQTGIGAGSPSRPDATATETTEFRMDSIVGSILAEIGTWLP
jgi:hypothetical protein